MIRLTRAQVREIDRLAVEKYHMPSIVLMENAARSAAEVAMSMIPSNRRAAILCGAGSNGGDGWAIARHLHNRGVGVEIIDLSPKPLSGDALTNQRIAQAMKIKTSSWHGLPAHAGGCLIVDAIVGTGLSKPPAGDFRSAIETLNLSGLLTLAVDLPSGLDCDTGQPLEIAVRATKTITFVAEKIGFANPASKQYTGEIIVGDIGCPRGLIEEVTRT